MRFVVRMCLPDGMADNGPEILFTLPDIGGIKEHRIDDLLNVHTIELAAGKAGLHIVDWSTGLSLQPRDGSTDLQAFFKQATELVRKHAGNKPGGELVFVDQTGRGRQSSYLAEQLQLQALYDKDTAKWYFEIVGWRAWLDMLIDSAEAQKALAKADYRTDGDFRCYSISVIPKEAETNWRKEGERLCKLLLPHSRVKSGGKRSFVVIDKRPKR